MLLLPPRTMGLAWDVIAVIVGADIVHEAAEWRDYLAPRQQRGATAGSSGADDGGGGGGGGNDGDHAAMRRRASASRARGASPVRDGGGSSSESSDDSGDGGAGEKGRVSPTPAAAPANTPLAVPPERSLRGWRGRAGRWVERVARSRGGRATGRGLVLLDAATSGSPIGTAGSLLFIP